jgi:hypothetical protein
MDSPIIAALIVIAFFAVVLSYVSEYMKKHGG